MPVVIIGTGGLDLMTIDLPTWPTLSLKIEGSHVGNLPDLKALVALLREGKIKPPAITSRALAEVNDSIQDLLHGKLTG